MKMIHANAKRMMMTMVGGLGLLFVLACGTVNTVAAQGPGTEAFRQFIGAPTTGDSVLVGAYCVRVDTSFMKAFTAVVVEGGDSAYWDFIRQPSVPCYDIRVHSVKPVRSTLMKKLWEFELPSRQRFNMWEVQDEKGNLAYTWIPVEGQET